MNKLIALLLTAAFVMAGCNTVRGIGQDVQKAGNSLEKAAK